MNALCKLCPLGIMCDVFLPPVDQQDRRILDCNYALRTENARLRELAIENGLSYGCGEQSHGENIQEG